MSIASHPKAPKPQPQSQSPHPHPHPPLKLVCIFPLSLRGLRVDRLDWLVHWNAEIQIRVRVQVQVTYFLTI